MITDVLGDGVITAALLGFKFVAAYIAIMWLALVFWTARDIRQRTTDLWVQGAAIMLALAFFLPGYWLYLVLRPRYTLKERAEERYREAIFAEYSSVGDCPACHRKTREEFVICPYCEYQLRKSCEACSHALLSSWTACPYCGTRTTKSLQVEGPVPTATAPAPLGSQPAHA